LIVSMSMGFFAWMQAESIEKAQTLGSGDKACLYQGGGRAGAGAQASCVAWFS
jgi:hypothetical protein